MGIKRVINNKYTNRVQSLVKSAELFGVRNAAALYGRRNEIRLENIFRAFKDNKSRKIIELTEKKTGERHSIDSHYKMGYCVFAPVIYDYVQWLSYCTKSYDKLWFLSREGWLLKKAFDIYTEESAVSRYIITSRRAASLACVKNIDDIIEILEMYYRGSAGNLIQSRLGVKTDNNIYCQMPEDIDSVMNCVDTASVIEKAKKERESYIKYLGDTKGSIAVADVGYKGTIQYYLSKLTGSKIDGYYICSHFDCKPFKLGCKCQSLFPVVNLLDERENNIFVNQLYFEAVLKAPFGQLEYFDTEGKPVYNNDGYVSRGVEDIQKGILDFVRDMGHFDYEKRKSLSYEMPGAYIKGGYIKDSLLKSLYVEDSYCSDGVISLGNVKA